MHPWILKKVGISRLKELADKKFGVRLDTGPRGTGGELAASRALELHGASYQNIKSWGGSLTHSAYSEAINRLMDGHIDMFMNDDIVGHPLFIELSSARDVVLLPMEGNIVKELKEQFGYDSFVIPPGTYKGQDKDVLEIAQHHVFFCNKEAPEDLVYAMTKLIFANKDRLVAAHKLFSKLDRSVGPKAFPMPLHPGAERYYKEIGIQK
jgi:TRAP transporter TAXI family solute receptor